MHQLHQLVTGIFHEPDEISDVYISLVILSASEGSQIADLAELRMTTAGAQDDKGMLDANVLVQDGLSCLHQL